MKHALTVIGQQKSIKIIFNELGGNYDALSDFDQIALIKAGKRKSLILKTSYSENVETVYDGVSVKKVTEYVFDSALIQLVIREGNHLKQVEVKEALMEYNLYQYTTDSMRKSFGRYVTKKMKALGYWKDTKTKGNNARIMPAVKWIEMLVDYSIEEKLTVDFTHIISLTIKNL